MHKINRNKMKIIIYILSFPANKGDLPTSSKDYTQTTVFE